MKQKIIKQVSLFFGKIFQIFGAFILTILFLIQYITNTAWELVMMVFAHVDTKEKKEMKEIDEGYKKISRFSYIWKLLEHQSAKQVSTTILTHAKEAAHNTNKRFWIDMETIVPILLTISVLFLLFIALGVFGILTILSGWIVFLFGFALYFVFLSWIRRLFKKFLGGKPTVFFWAVGFSFLIEFSRRFVTVFSVYIVDIGMHFFLHGGMARIDSDKNKKFFQNICKDGDKILICVFATTDKSTWEERFINYQKQFAKYNPNKQLSFELASEDIPTFVQQIERCSVVYFGGGYEDNLFAILNDVPNLRELLQNKVIIGSSAGTNIFVSSFYTQDLEAVKEGWGWLPIKTICHRGPGAYDNDVKSHEARLAELDAYGEKLPIYKIPEQEYVEFTL